MWHFPYIPFSSPYEVTVRKETRLTCLLRKQNPRGQLQRPIEYIEADERIARADARAYGNEKGARPESVGSEHVETKEEV
jgi:hypothetical protein